MTITPVPGTDDLTWLDAGGVKQSSIVVETVAIGSLDANGNLVTGTTVSTTNAGNSSNANLANGAAFTGTGVDVSRYATVVVSVYSSHVSATNGLQFQWSVDNTNWRTSDTYTVPATTLKTFAVQVQFQYFRLVYTNGGTLTTTLNIQTLLKSGTNPVSSQKPAFARSLENDMQEVIAYGGVYNGTTLDLTTKPNATSRLLSAAASVNSTLVRAGATDLYGADGYNNNAAARFLKIYDKATAPTVGTDTPRRTMRLPPTAQYSFSFTPPLYVSLGLGYGITTAAADADTGALTAGDIVAQSIDYSASA